MLILMIDTKVKIKIAAENRQNNQKDGIYGKS